MKNHTGAPALRLHAIEVHDETDTLVRVHMQHGGKYWPVGGEPHHPVHGAGDYQGVVVVHGETS